MIPSHPDDLDELDVTARSIARRQPTEQMKKLRRLIMDAYLAWCRQVPGIRKEGGAVFKHDGMVLRDTRPLPQNVIRLDPTGRRKP